jgi:hypothetical protein
MNNRDLFTPAVDQPVTEVLSRLSHYFSQLLVTSGAIT